MHSDEAHAGGDGRFFADDGERARGDLFGGFESRGRGGAETELELTCVDLREDFGAEEGNYDADGKDRAGEVGGDEEVAGGERWEEKVAQRGVGGGFGLGVFFRLAVPPDAQDGHEG